MADEKMTTEQLIQPITKAEEKAAEIKRAALARAPRQAMACALRAGRGRGGLSPAPEAEVGSGGGAAHEYE